MGFIEKALTTSESKRLRASNLLQAERYGQAAALLLDQDTQAAAELHAKAAAVASLVAQTDKATRETSG